MDRIRSLAALSVGRACFFAGFAIWATMFALIVDPVLALRVGAALVSIVACVLLIKAHNAAERPYRETEVWLLMDRKTDLPADRIQRAIGGALTEIYRRYARYALAIAAIFWFLAIVSNLIWPGWRPKLI
ncbi:MAG: hypothetical protein SGJ07_10345 [Rhodospirillaceae bacterium]|nr:hypothetical protein [Rhodospirillaceae bacterium]